MACVRPACRNDDGLEFEVGLFEVCSWHEPDPQRCPQIGRYWGKTGHRAGRPFRSKMTQLGHRCTAASCAPCHHTADVPCGHIWTRFVASIDIAPLRCLKKQRSTRCFARKIVYDGAELGRHHGPRKLAAEPWP